MITVVYREALGSRMFQDVRQLCASGESLCLGHPKSHIRSRSCIVSIDTLRQQTTISAPSTAEVYVEGSLEKLSH